MKIVPESQLNLTPRPWRPLCPSRFDLNREGRQANATTSVDSLLNDCESKPERQSHFGEFQNMVEIACVEMIEKYIELAMSREE